MQIKIENVVSEMKLRPGAVIDYPAAKRLGIELVDLWYFEDPMMPQDIPPHGQAEVWDWWHGYSPRNGRGASVEGTWEDWVKLAKWIVEVEAGGGPYMDEKEDE